MKLFIYKVNILFCLLLPLLTTAQTEPEIKEKADKLFAYEQFVDATPLYLRLLSLQPKNTEYNFKFGTCLLYNSNKKQDALKYLNYAVSDPAMNPEAWYYLGKALQLNYQFNEAIKNYSIYLQKAGNKARPELLTQRQIETCHNGKKLMTTITDLVVASKVEISIDKFYDLYKLEKIGGQILVTVDFQSKIDKKKNHIPLVHFPADAKQIFYASYGESEGNGLDIYVRRRIPNGEWGEPQLVSGGVNTKFDENYPFMDSEGRYLYFSSKGHNSMGGYDVFRCRFDEENNSFSSPENMDFAVSSPDDDILYMVDAEEENAYFASARQSSDNKVFVYNVRVDRVPIQLAVVKGDFTSKIDPTAKISITIKDFSTGTEIGKFASNDKKSYLLTFPKGGKYEYVMNVEGSDDTYRAVVSIPFLKEFKPLKQAIVHEESAEGTIIRVIDQFDQEVEDAQGIIAQILKERSELNVNIQNFDLNKLNTKNNNEELLSELGLKNYGLSEISALLKSKEPIVSETANANSNLEQRILSQVTENNKQSAELTAKIKSLSNQANQAATKHEKQELLLKAKELIDQQNNISAESKKLLAMTDTLKGTNQTSSSKKLEELQSLEKQLNSLIAEGKDEDAFSLLDANKELIKEVVKAENSNLQSRQIEAIQQTDNEIAKLTNERNAYDAQVRNLNSEISQLEVQMRDAKKKEVESIQNNINSKKQEILLLEDQLTYLNSRLDDKRNERALLSNELEVSTKIANQQLPEVSLKKESVKSAFLETNSVNTSSLQKYVLAELSKVNGEVSTVVSNKSTYRKYEEEKNAVMQDPVLTSAEKLEKLKQIENDKISELAFEIETLESYTSDNPEDKEALERLRILSEDKLKIEEDQTNKVDNTLIQTESVSETMNFLDSEYKADIEKIKNDNSLDPIARESALYEKNKATLAKIDSQLVMLDEQLNSQPENTILKAKKDNLVELKQQFENYVQQHKNKLDELKAPLTATSKEAVFDFVFPKYEERLASITEDPNLSESDKITQRIALEENALSAINKELALTKKNSVDEVERQKYAFLEDLRSQKEGELLVLKKQVESTKLVLNTQADIFKEISPDYDEKRDAINKNLRLSDAERKDELNNLDKELLVKIEQRRILVQQDLENSPEDKSLSNDLKLLDVMLDNTRKDLEQRNGLNTAVTIELTEQQLKDQLAPTYEANRKRILAGKDSDLKNQELDALDRELVERMNKRKDEIEQELERNPNDAGLSRELGIIETIIAKTEREINERELKREVAGNEINEESILEQIAPNYKKEQEILDSRNDLSENERLKALLENDRELITALDDRIEKLSNDSGLSVNAEKELEILQEQKSLAENKIAEQSQRRVSILVGEIERESLISSIDKNYSKNIAEAKARNDREKELKAEGNLKEKLQSEFEKDSKNKDPEESLARKKVLEELLSANASRIDALDQPLITENNSQNSQQTLTSLKLESGLENEDIRTFEPETLEELKRREAQLDEYETKLLSKLKTEVDKSPGNESFIDDLKNEIDLVQEKRRAFSISIGELETSSLAAQNKSNNSNSTISDPEIRRLNTEMETLQSQLAGTENKSEQKRIISQIEKIENETKVRENEIIGENLNKAKSENDKLTGELENRELSENLQLSLVGNERQNKEIDKLRDDAGKAKDPASKNYLLQEAENKQLVLNANLKNSLENEKVAALEKELNVSLATDQILEERIRKGTISIGELEFELENLRRELENAKKKDQPALEERIALLEKERDLLKRNLDQQKKLNESRKVESTLAENAIDEKITYEEEYQLATSEEYKSIVKEAKAVLQTENEIKKLQQENDLLRREIQSESSKGVKPENIPQINTLKQNEIKIGELKTSLGEKQQEVSQAIRQNPEAMKIQNLLARGVDSIARTGVAASLIALPMSGLSISNKAEIKPSAVAIPVGVKSPGGLVYRVQIGAFSRPIPEATFREFDPVSGEKLSNGITRYMAGYFNSETQANNAKDQIRDLGYSDAFLVVYCDGQRVSLAEARKLQASGSCVPKQSEALIYEASNNTAEKLGIKDTSKQVRISPSSYNKAPGAAPAEAVEERQGLFFTVQVGVYNKPVPPSQLKNISPLITKRLENGQIRYSSGIFKSAAEAKPKQAEAVQRGISDAFIVAYYKGERITVAVANKLLEQNGPSILEEAKKEVVAVKPIKEEPVITVANPPVKKTVYYQLRTEEKFVDYPRDILKRFNTRGNFYYDKNDSLIKSVYYEDYRLPAVGSFEIGLDTIVRSQAQLQDSNYVDLRFVIEGSSIPGGLGDYLQRLNYGKSWSTSRNGLELTVYGVRTFEVEEVRQRIKIYVDSEKIVEEWE